jgi:predicted phosphate transport protein (TIGR00153 family)
MAGIKFFHMTINSFINFLLPRDKSFYPLFEKAAANLKACAEQLTLVVTATSPEQRIEHMRQVEKLEHIGDEIAHEIFNELGRNFITPFDREDIHTLTSRIDDVLDYIHGASKRMELYKITNYSPEIVKLSQLILQSAVEINNAVFELRNLKNLRKITDACVRINSIENHADDIFDRAVARLFEEEQNALEVIKMKEILSALETATDKAEDVANVLESIIVKVA